MKKSSVIYSNFLGINNLEKGNRLDPTSKGSWLVSASNFHIDRTRQLVTRDGVESLDSAYYHSIFIDKGSNKAYGVRNNNLITFNPRGTFSYKNIRSRVGSNRFSFVRIGDNIWGTNNEIIGYIDSNDNWNELPSVTQTYKRPLPAGHFIEFYKGIVYIAYGRFIICSDPEGFHFYDERQDKAFIQFRSKITMLKCDGDGLWVADKEQVSYLTGDGPEEFIRTVYDLQVIENTADSDEYSVWFTTNKGICKGGKDKYGNKGKLTRITESNYLMPSIVSGVGFLKEGEINEYISILK